jgi:hypothetical protein
MVKMLQRPVDSTALVAIDSYFAVDFGCREHSIDSSKLVSIDWYFAVDRGCLKHLVDSRTSIPSCTVDFDCVKHWASER